MTQNPDTSPKAMKTNRDVIERLHEDRDQRKQVLERAIGLRKSLTTVVEKTSSDIERFDAMIATYESMAKEPELPDPTQFEMPLPGGDGLPSVAAVAETVLPTSHVVKAQFTGGYDPTPDPIDPATPLQDEGIPLSTNELYDRLLDSYYADMYFRPMGDLVSFFRNTGFDVTRDQVRRAVRRGLKEKKLIRLRYTDSLRYTWYGLTEMTEVDDDGTRRVANPGFLQRAAKYQARDNDPTFAFN